MQTAQFLPAWLYCEPYIAELEYELYAKRCWHPIAAGSELGAGQALALELLGGATSADSSGGRRDTGVSQPLPPQGRGPS